MSAEWNPTDTLSFRLAGDYVEDTARTPSTAIRKRRASGA